MLKPNKKTGHDEAQQDIFRFDEEGSKLKITRT